MISKEGLNKSFNVKIFINVPNINVKIAYIINTLVNVKNYKIRMIFFFFVKIAIIGLGQGGEWSLKNKVKKYVKYQLLRDLEPLLREIHLLKFLYIV